MIKTASFSPCGKYRYQLNRVWDDSKKIVMCVGLNPSTANYEKDDSTIRYLVGALTALGYGGFVMTNLYALVSSKPEALWLSADPQCDNDLCLQVARAYCDEIIYCWGSFKGIEHRAKKIKELYPGGLCFGKAKLTGQPLHPQALARRGVKFQDVKLFPA